MDQTIRRARNMQHLLASSRFLGLAARGITRARPSAGAALQAGLLAGTAVLLVLQVLAVVAYDESPWKLLRMVAALARGPQALEPDDEFDAAVIATGLLLHYALAMLYGLALACVLTDTPRRHAGLVGVAFGVALHYGNLYGFTALFPWFSEMRTVDTLVAHAFFGFLLARSYVALRCAD